MWLLSVLEVLWKSANHYEQLIFKEIVLIMKYLLFMCHVYDASVIQAHYLLPQLVPLSDSSS